MEDKYGFKSFKIKPILGAPPEDPSWMTPEDWKEHEDYVERLKKEGKYLTEGEEVTLNFKKYEPFVPDSGNDKPAFSNFGLFIPGDISRHADSTPATYISPEDKRLFILWMKGNQYDLEAFNRLSGKQKEEIVSAWRILKTLNEPK